MNFAQLFVGFRIDPLNVNMEISNNRLGGSARPRIFLGRCTGLAEGSREFLFPDCARSPTPARSSISLLKLPDIG